MYKIYNRFHFFFLIIINNIIYYIPHVPLIGLESTQLLHTMVKNLERARIMNKFLTVYLIWCMCDTKTIDIDIDFNEKKR